MSRVLDGCQHASRCRVRRIPLGHLTNAAIRKAIAQGTTLATFRQDFDALVARRGWTGWTGEGSEAGRAWRARIIYETNLRSSYAAGRWAQIQQVKEVRPYLLYRHNDNVLHPRPLHVSWNGLVIKADDPWWQTHFPPNGWGCQCRVHAVDESYLRQQGKAGPDVAPDDGTYDWTDKASGKTFRDIPNGVDPGWDYAPGANVTTPLRELIDQKLFNLDAPIGAAMWKALKDVVAMERELEWWHTLDEWLTTPQIGRLAVVGALSPSSLEWLRTQKEIIPQSAGIAIREGLIRGTKQARHDKSGDGLTLEEWRQLPRMIDDPEQILFDTRTGKLVFVMASTDAAIKIAVAFDYRIGKEVRFNMAVSGFRHSTATIAQMIKGGLYEVVK